MGWISDSVEEFRKLPPAGKLAFGGAAVGVAILAYVSFRANSANSAAAQTANTTTGAFPGLLGGATTTTTSADPAGGSWSITQASFQGLFNGSGLPYRSAPTPSATTAPPTGGPMLSTVRIASTSGQVTNSETGLPMLTFKPLVG